MSFDFLPFFNKKEHLLVVPDSILVKQLKSLSTHANIEVLHNIEIFHHKESFTIDLMLLDNTRGLYIFESKQWSFEELKNATVQKAHNQKRDSNTLAFQQAHSIIKNKLGEVLHDNNIAIHNYLLMENLSAHEYEHLNDSLKSLLPKERIIFNDSSPFEILNKLAKVSDPHPPLPGKQILATLLTQYTIPSYNGKEVYLCNQEQKEWIQKPVQGIFNLSSPPNAGASSILLLKAIYEVFTNRCSSVTIVKPTATAQDFACVQLEEIINHGRIDLDLSRITVTTPQKVEKADLILCDDAFALDDDFVRFLQKMQKRHALVFVNLPESSLETQQLSHSFTPKEFDLRFVRTNPYPKAIHLLYILTHHDPKTTVAVVSSQKTQQQLHEDLQGFLEVALLDLQHKTKPGVMLCNYEQVYDLHANYLLALDACEVSHDILNYAIHKADTKSYVLYEQNCDTLATLRMQRNTINENNQK